MKPLLALLLCCFTAAAVEVDFVIHWQGVDRGLITVPSMLTNATTGRYVGWNNTGSGTNGQRFSIVERTNTMTFPFSVTVSNVAVTSAGTNWLRANWEPDIGNEFLALEFPGGYAAPEQTNVVIAGWVLFDFTGTLDSTDLQYIRDNTGQHTTSFNMWGDLYARAHATTPTSVYGPIVQASNLKLFYYVRNHADASTNMFVRLYDPDANYTLVGESITNSTVPTKAWDLQFVAGYLATPARGVYWGPLVGIYDPTDAEISALVPQLDFVTVSNTVAAALAGDVILLPSGAAPWTNTLVIGTSNVVLTSIGTAWLTNWFSTGPDYDTPLIQISAPGVTISNINIVGASATTGGGISVYGLNARIAHCGFTGLRVPIFTYAASNVTDNCWFSEIAYLGRFRSTTENGDAFWTAYYPLPWDTLNASFVEDCYVTNTIQTAATVLFFEGQRGAYVARKVHFYLSGLNEGYQFADMHGDDNTQRGTLLAILSENDVTFSNGAYSLATAIDLRGGMALICSNTFNGTPQYVRLQEECDYPTYGFPAGRDWVTNSFMWDNTGMAGAFVRYDPPTDSSTNYLTIGAAGSSSFTLAAPADFAAATYPHPLRGEGGAPAEPATYGPPAIRGNIAFRGGVTIRGN